jgi:hypothetical protein
VESSGRGEAFSGLNFGKFQNLKCCCILDTLFQILAPSNKNLAQNDKTGQESALLIPFFPPRRLTAMNTLRPSFQAPWAFHGAQSCA